MKAEPEHTGILRREVHSFEALREEYGPTLAAKVRSGDIRVFVPPVDVASLPSGFPPDWEIEGEVLRQVEVALMALAPFLLGTSGVKLRVGIEDTGLYGHLDIDLLRRRLAAGAGSRKRLKGAHAFHEGDGVFPRDESQWIKWDEPANICPWFWNFSQRSNESRDWKMLGLLGSWLGFDAECKIQHSLETLSPVREFPHATTDLFTDGTRKAQVMALASELLAEQGLLVMAACKGCRRRFWLRREVSPQGGRPDRQCDVRCPICRVIRERVQNRRRQRKHKKKRRKSGNA